MLMNIGLGLDLPGPDQDRRLVRLVSTNFHHRNEFIESNDHKSIKSLDIN